MEEQAQEKLELLSVELLDQNRSQVQALRQLAKALSLEFGWHYLLDLTWIIRQLGDVKGKRILDAGAGTGILQWYLAERGATVVSVDRMSRANLPLRFRSRFHVKGLRPQDLQPYPAVMKANFSTKGRWQNKVTSQARDLARSANLKRAAGRVIIYNQDLKHLDDIGDQTIDAVVAVSALEHNAPDDLELVVNELMRVLRPGGVLAASLNAARDEDWWHTPSSGWCYTEASLRRRFCLSPETTSNYDRYDEIFAGICASVELRTNLAKFYFRSADNGMPWGKWDPQYVPVGVCKVKS